MTALLLFLFGTLIVSFLCSVLEATLMSTPISYITMREEEGYKPAGRMKEYKSDSSRPIAAILSLNTIANTVGAAGVGRQATLVFGSEWFGLVSALMTILILVFSEIIPKTIGTRHWKSMMGFTVACIRVLTTVLYPLVICAEWIIKLISPHSTQGNSISREEVGAMADVAEESGELDEDENEIIQNLINLDDMTVKSAMTPRVVAAIAPESMTIKSFYKDHRFRHSRIPVYADNDEYITGYILRMDALQLMAEDKFDKKLADIRREVDSLPEETSLADAWTKMLEKNEQLAVVIDRYGAFQGIVTMEDIIETVVGDEIVDERDAVADMQQLAADEWNKRKTAQHKA